MTERILLECGHDEQGKRREPQGRPEQIEQDHRFSQTKKEYYDLIANRAAHREDRKYRARPLLENGYHTCSARKVLQGMNG